MTETDWMWVYENPKEAAKLIDRLRAALREIAEDYVDPREVAMRALGQSPPERS